MRDLSVKPSGLPGINEGRLLGALGIDPHGVEQDSTRIEFNGSVLVLRYNGVRFISSEELDAALQEARDA